MRSSNDDSAIGSPPTSYNDPAPSLENYDSLVSRPRPLGGVKRRLFRVGQHKQHDLKQILILAKIGARFSMKIRIDLKRTKSNSRGQIYLSKTKDVGKTKKAVNIESTTTTSTKTGCGVESAQNASCRSAKRIKNGKQQRIRTD